MLSLDRYMENRIKGIIEAYLFGDASLDWLQNSLEKNHSTDEVLNILKEHGQHFQQINSLKLQEITSRINQILSQRV